MPQTKKRNRVGGCLKAIGNGIEELLVAAQPGPMGRATRGHDLNIWNLKKAIEKAEYCHNNPVKRGLVKRARDWRWSSFRWLVENARKDEPLEMDKWAE